MKNNILLQILAHCAETHPGQDIIIKSDDNWYHVWCEDEQIASIELKKIEAPIPKPENKVVAPKEKKVPKKKIVWN